MTRRTDPGHVTVSEFSVSFPRDQVEDLRARLRRTKWSDDFDNDDWSFGVNGDYLRDFASYWCDDYDWDAAEQRLNQYPGFRVDGLLDGTPIHFLHIRGKGPNPTPIVLTHGWPWTVWDYAKVVDPLTDPVRFGGRAEDSFDVVIPALPGFGYSSPLRSAVTPMATSDVWSRLMTEVLGYPRYMAAGADWGALVTSYLGHKHADEIIGIHLTIPTLISIAGAESWSSEDYSPDEAGRWSRMVDEKLPLMTSHYNVHVLDPQTLAWALEDSPVGLAAWILERRRSWSDHDGDFEKLFSRDGLCDSISTYWFTHTIGTSMRYYANASRTPLPRTHQHHPPVQTPLAMSVFLNELILPPRSVVEQNSNLVQWRTHDRGGHFAAHEQPDAWVNDVRAFRETLAASAEQTPAH
ncbi:epoxide hydrolase family protein [Rhodococcus sp. NPDC057529]|uniref:epoxide hydrolase family protein n=1 Tax=Rhodococcus sp. NPDC057529 TaxID=3346158 RepID=UPI00366BB374